EYLHNEESERAFECEHVLLLCGFQERRTSWSAVSSQIRSNTPADALKGVRPSAGTMSSDGNASELLLETISSSMALVPYDPEATLGNVVHNGSLGCNQSGIISEPSLFDNLTASSGGSGRVARGCMGQAAEVGQKNWAALLILAVVGVTVTGNILVIMAVSLERKLQNATNYFLMSLAFADMLLGLLVMPVSMVTILYGELDAMPSAMLPFHQNSWDSSSWERPHARLPKVPVSRSLNRLPGSAECRSPDVETD
ncbi:hypothetical protein NFI96_029798, partial [Prochilodus magdalenae]